MDPGTVVATIEVPPPTDPAAALAAVVALRRLADRLEMAAARAAVEQGWSWTDVAGELGISRQAAHKKFARRVSQRA